MSTFVPGRIIHQFPEGTLVSAIARNADQIFVTTNNGVFLLNPGEDELVEIKPSFEFYDEASDVPEHLFTERLPDPKPR